MVWYAAEPMAELDPDRAMELALDSPLPNMVGYTTPGIARTGTERGLQALEASLGKTENPDYVHSIQVVIDSYASESAASTEYIAEMKTRTTIKLILASLTRATP